MPFVGAGFSARKPVRKGEFDPSAAEMQRRLEDLIPRDNPTAQRAAAESGAVYVRPRSAQNGAPDRLRRSSAGNSVVKTTSLAKTAEIASWFTTNSEILKKAKIKKFATLAPTDCHRYLAYMAREGWITQVLSTNYDTCIEKAFEESYGAGRSQGAACPIEKITSLKDYTRYGAEAHRRGEPLLHLYKLNGCAEKYNGDRSHEILLTERQLQKMRSDGWKHAMLGHIGRTHTLLFSGFGAEEPQIRHTVLALIDDFAADNNHRGTENNDRQQDASQCYGSPEGDIRSRTERGCQEPSAPCQRPHAPWVTTYDAEPTFPQTQLLMAFVDAYAPSRGGNGRSGSLLDRIYDLVIGGADEPALRDPNWYGRLQEATQPAPGCDAAHPKLPADLLWKRLYQLAMAQRLADDLPTSPLVGWMRDIGVSSDRVSSVVDELWMWLTGSGSRRPAGRVPSAMWLWDNDAATTMGSTHHMPLMNLFVRMTDPHGGGGNARYRPYRSDRLGWWIVLALIYFLHEKYRIYNHFHSIPGIGVVWTGEPSLGTRSTRAVACPRLVLAFNSGALPAAVVHHPSTIADGDIDQRYFIRVLVPSDYGSPAGGKISFMHGADRLSGEFDTVPVERIFREVIVPLLARKAGAARSKTGMPSRREQAATADDVCTSLYREAARFRSENRGNRTVLRGTE